MVVNWNRKQLLRACLSSLARQNDVDFETIVVDNGSSDGSADMAESEFGARVIRNRENRGFCAANNQGIAVARGEFVALLNNDAEAEPDWLALGGNLGAAFIPCYIMSLEVANLLTYDTRWRHTAPHTTEAQSPTGGDLQRIEDLYPPSPGD